MKHGGSGRATLLRMNLRTRLLLSWGVHAYTASGGILGFFALLAAAGGDTRHAFLLLMAAFAIDATDGLLARGARVDKHLPRFSGAAVDDAVDVFTYIYVPLFIIAREGLLPHPAWLALPILAGLYAYGQRDMKTADHYFLGFPSYWNVVALYLYWLRPGSAAALAFILVPTALTFLPTRYLYPSHKGAFWKTNFGLGAMWVALVCALLLQSEPARPLILLSLTYPAIYMSLSFYMEYRLRFGVRGPD